MPEEAADAFAFSPGAGAALNCFFPLLNTQGHDTATKWSNAGLHRSKDPGVGAFTPYHGRTSYAIRDVAAGEELFTDYGENYFTYSEEIFGLIPLYGSYDEADVLLRRYVATRDEILSSVPVEERNATIATIHADWYNIVTNMSSRWESRVLNALPRNPDLVDEIAEIGTSQLHANRSIRSIDWLAENGYCMDNLYEDRSLIRQAGRGAFARRFIPEGGLVGPAPLIQIDRYLTLMYPRQYNEEYQHKYQFDRNSSNFTEQLIVNYCFGHDNSSVLLCPYGMMTSLINHNSEEPNAKVVWNRDLMKHPEWLEMAPGDWLYEGHAGLNFDVVATRDILPGDEVYMDYGKTWEAKWRRHVQNWSPPAGAETYRPAAEYNDDTELVLRTMSETPYYDGNQLQLKCHEAYRQFNGLPAPEDEEIVYHDCGVVLRTIAGNVDTGQTGIDNVDPLVDIRYIAVVYERSEEEVGQSYLVRRNRGRWCRETVVEVLFDLPRDAFWFEDVPYTRDSAQPWAFRQPIAIPDDLMPEIWLDLAGVGYEGEEEVETEEWDW